MPVEKSPEMIRVKRNPTTTHLEAVGRLLAGMAPWLELGPDNTPEGKLREQYIQLAVGGLRNGTDPKSPDYLAFDQTGQSLVDAAFLSHALLRAPNQLWGRLDETTKQQLVTALKLSRATKPGENNWLLFSAMVETALLKFTGEGDTSRIMYAIRRHKEWYKGDGVYGDGKDFHFDYYNSYVIHPMLVDILKEMQDQNFPTPIDYNTEKKRITRFAEIQERLISPEATYPVVGRSIVYRCGAFQSLSQVALQQSLPKTITEAQTRFALFSLIKKQMEMPGTFDEKGWLQIGVAGHQAVTGDYYISTGSLYLCAEAYLILGLPPQHSFWKGADEDWTNRKVWKGIAVPVDHAMEN
jgi:hypothetical protein